MSVGSSSPRLGGGCLGAAERLQRGQRSASHLAPPPAPGPAPLRPQCGPGPAPPRASASSFRVALGRLRRGRAAAREFGCRPRALASWHRLVAGEANGARSPGPYRVRPSFSSSLLRVSVFLRRWGWAGPGRRAALWGASARGRCPRGSPLPCRSRRACGVCWGLRKQLLSLGCFSAPVCPQGGRHRLCMRTAQDCLHRYLRAVVTLKPLGDRAAPYWPPALLCTCCSCVCCLDFPLASDGFCLRPMSLIRTATKYWQQPLFCI